MEESWILAAAFLGGVLLTVLLFGVYIKRIFWSHDKKVKERMALARREAFLDARESQSAVMEQFEKKRVAIEQAQRKKEVWIEQEEWQVKERRAAVEGQVEALEERIASIEELEKRVRARDEEVEDLSRLYRKRLVKLGHMDEGEAREYLLEEVGREYAGELERRRRDLYERSTEELENEAQKLLLASMHRLHMTPASNASAAVVKLPSEDIKGRLIGKDGRNIKAFESATGVNLVIDESPGVVIVSSFDPVRREVAQVALEGLIKDGRVQPLMIESFVERAKGDMEGKLLEIGRARVSKMGLGRVPEEVLETLGRLNYHLSNNQNTLDHSEEVGYLCSMMASELGLDAGVAKRCGLFHDLGKALSHEYEGDHAEAAARLLRRHGEDARVVEAVAMSHEDLGSGSLYGELLKIADAVSAMRPGARCDSLDGYVSRVKALEGIAMEFEGVGEAYALQAGREIRVVVEPNSCKDEDAFILAGKIRQRVEQQMRFPGKIKVTVIREQRFCEVAK